MTFYVGFSVVDELRDLTSHKRRDAETINRSINAKETIKKAINASSGGAMYGAVTKQGRRGSEGKRKMRQKPAGRHYPRAG